MTSTPTTIDDVTELSAVNSILGAIGQSPINELDFSNPEISFIYNILKDVNRDIQDEGWIFNTEHHYTLSPDANNQIALPSNILRMDVTDGQNNRVTNVVKRGGKLYDKVEHSYKFTKDQHLDIVWLFEFRDLPSVFQRYITLRASTRAASQLVSSPELTQMLAQQEAFARASCMEYECNQGDYSVMGHPEGTKYQSYQPSMALNRYA
ncbi:MAG: hypothetical protein CMP96_05615 [Gammaproteobacteria bacterium]|nr:hypothetical protein [Gammaproteobacteria bacterium]|tara:strand:- start:4667 stop:5290 length:624 start_codon:yes stop_codon:yes gene_type:complete